MPKSDYTAFSDKSEPLRSRRQATPSRQLPIELAREKRTYVTAPSAKVRPPDPRPRYGFPPANAGALGAAQACSFFVKFVRSPRCRADISLTAVTSLQQCGNNDAGYSLL